MFVKFDGFNGSSGDGSHFRFGYRRLHVVERGELKQKKIMKSQKNYISHQRHNLKFWRIIIRVKWKNPIMALLEPR